MGQLSDGRNFVITMTVDVTDQMAAQEKLRALSRATDQNMSELASPITMACEHEHKEMSGYLPDETIDRESSICELSANSRGAAQDSGKGV